jgi:hypothetical protein
MTTPDDPNYRKAHKGTSYFNQGKKTFVCSSGTWNVQSTGSCFGSPDAYGPTMVLQQGGTVGIFFATPIALSQAQSVCNHPTISGIENDWVQVLPTADGLGTILVILNPYLENSKSKISYAPIS